jgi:hypothetical protein
MWQIFGLELVRFSILVFSALAFFALFWLYFDAWRVKKYMRDIPLMGGYLLLAFSFLLQATTFETRIFTSVINIDYFYLRIAAYLCIVGGLLLVPIEKRPTLRSFVGVLLFPLPLLSGFIGLLYWRRASIGLENHLKKIAFGFLGLSLYEFFGLGVLFRSTQSVWISQLMQPYGPVNIAQYICLIFSLVIFARWAWYYLLKRLSTQLFMLSLWGTVFLSLVITGIFVSLLLKSIEGESLQKLTSNAKVMMSNVEEKKARLLSETKYLAQDPAVVNSIATEDRKILSVIVKDHMEKTGTDSVLVVNREGKVIVRGENEEERGVSLSDDSDVKKALKGEFLVGFISKQGVLSPEVSIRVLVPAGEGVVIASYVLDNAYMDGIKASTGMSATMYGNHVISATSELNSADNSRLIGIRETNSRILSEVWGAGRLYAQVSSVGDNTYLAGYIPLKDTSNTPIAVLQIAEPQVQSLQTASTAIQMTFILIICIIIFLSFPLYWITQNLVAEWE